MRSLLRPGDVSLPGADVRNKVGGRGFSAVNGVVQDGSDAELVTCCDQ
jgi:hypothetical protein